MLLLLGRGIAAAALNAYRKFIGQFISENGQFRFVNENGRVFVKEKPLASGVFIHETNDIRFITEDGIALSQE